MMSQTGPHKWGFVLAFFARAFVVAFAGVALYRFFANQSSTFLPHVAKLILFIILVSWRYLRSRTIFFIPDEMLLTLPWFWLISISKDMHQWHSGLIVAALLLALLSAISRPCCYAWFKGGICGNSLYAAVIASAAFYFSFAVLLNRVFADFTHELLMRSLHGGIWIFAGIFIMNAAFYSFFVASGKDNHLTVSADKSPEAA